jgi:hypothetical protein
LDRIWDKNLTTFAPCYPKSPPDADFTTPLYGFLEREILKPQLKVGGGLALFTLFLCLTLKIEKELTIRNAAKGGKPGRKLYHHFGFSMPLLNKKSSLFMNSIL